MAKVWIPGYTKDNGQKVKGHYRTIQGKTTDKTRKPRTDEEIVTAYKENFQGHEYTFKPGKNRYGVKGVFRHKDGVNTNQWFPISSTAENLKWNKKNAKRK